MTGRMALLWREWKAVGTGVWEKVRGSALRGLPTIGMAGGSWMTNLGFETNLEDFLFVLSGLEIKHFNSLAISVEFKNYKTE